MRKILLTSTLALALFFSSSAFARGWGGPGVFWGGFAGGAIVGSAIASNYYRPYYPSPYYAPYVVAPAYVQPQIVYLPPPVIATPQPQVLVSQQVQPQAYYCPTAGGFFPQVQSCPQGWQVTH